MRQPYAASRRTKHRRPLENIGKFAHVAGEGILPQRIKGVIFNIQRHGPPLLRQPRKKISGQQRNVLSPAAQGRQFLRYHGHAVIQITPEAPGLHLFLEVAVGGGDNAHVHGDVYSAPHTAQILLLQDAQQLDLHARRHFTYFVQKQRAAAGSFKQAFLAPHRA